MFMNFLAGMLIIGLLGWFGWSGWNALKDTIDGARERDFLAALSGGFLALIWLGGALTVVGTFAITAPAAYSAFLMVSSGVLVLAIDRKSREYVANTIWPILQLFGLACGLLVGAVTLWRYFS